MLTFIKVLQDERTNLDSTLTKLMYNTIVTVLLLDHQKYKLPCFGSLIVTDAAQPLLI